MHEFTLAISVEYLRNNLLAKLLIHNCAAQMPKKGIIENVNKFSLDKQSTNFISNENVHITCISAVILTSDSDVEFNKLLQGKGL